MSHEFKVGEKLAKSSTIKFIISQLSDREKPLNPAIK